MYDALAALIAVLKKTKSTQAQITTAVSAYDATWSALINTLTGNNLTAFAAASGSSEFEATYKSLASEFALVSAIPSTAYIFIKADQSDFSTLITEFFAALISWNTSS